MKRVLLLMIFCYAGAYHCFAQTGELQLAQQYTYNNAFQKAFDIYQKLYKLDNESYFSFYVNSLISLKRFDEAESVSKKLMRKHPADFQYAITLGRVYREQGKTDKADEVYSDLLNNLPADQNVITGLATQFYQAESADYAIRIFVQGRKLLHNEHLFSHELLSLYRFKNDKVNIIAEYMNFLPGNPDYVLQAESVLAPILDGEKDYDLLRTELLRHIQKQPEVTAFADLLTWQYMQQKQYDHALNQALALSRRRDDKGAGIYDLCHSLVSNGAYDEAIRGYTFIIEKSTRDDPFYIPAKIELIDVKNMKLNAGKLSQADITALEQDYLSLLSEFGKTANTALAIQRLANLQAFKLHKYTPARQLLLEAIDIPNLRPALLAQLKLTLGDIYLLEDQPWESTLIYSQVEKANQGLPVSQDAAYRNAKLAYYTGDFKWAKGQLDILKAATSQLIANDALNLSLLITDNITFDTTGNALKMYARADLEIFKQRSDRALLTLDSIDKKYPGNTFAGDILMAKARIHLDEKDFEKAITELKTVEKDYSKGIWADDAVFMLGNVYENNLNDKALAKIYYQKIITDYPGSLWINEARARFRLLRGDKPDNPS
ncbi:tetratricopeptide repeat protein [Mucilaginibacter ginkgonis]|uniref:Tetratricopeptide repeat protein n=1 Tax=Mucilaginibacter ginkgonis TaxID=2682091 RepID=A0A7T7FAN1_9SPHI|nr:tetratricopeptide repeat protein [Mucilaginibacter ginkgonis]QQL49875.1 tetratricopeptide repeat protein [Mucilaginibacter ginkgonis]